jgi:hypothetical protein
MSIPFALDTVLAVGVDPHRESLDVIAIHFPEEIVLDETFDNTRIGHRALWSKTLALAEEQGLSLIFGLEDGSNYGYASTCKRQNPTHPPCVPPGKTVGCQLQLVCFRL